MSVKVKKIEVEVQKELDEVFALFEKVASLVRSKGDVKDALADLVTAIDGVGEVPEGFKENVWEAVTTSSLRAISIAKVLTAPKAA